MSYGPDKFERMGRRTHTRMDSDAHTYTFSKDKVKNVLCVVFQIFVAFAVRQCHYLSTVFENHVSHFVQN